MAHFCLILTVLGRLLASFWSSWRPFGSHFGSLGASWGALLTQVGPSWPKIVKKVDFLNLSPRFGTQVGTQNEEKSTSKTMFFSDAFFLLNFIDFLKRFWTSILDVHWIDFWTQNENVDLSKIELSPRREHIF